MVLPADSPGTQEHRQRPLAEAINAATRNVHAKLNKLIIARLPLALPPHAADPSLYASGLLHIAPIYITFETLWQDLIRSPTDQEGSDVATGDPDVDDPSESNVGPTNNANDSIDADDHMTGVLRDLFLPGLMRSDRLRSDIRAITGWSPQIVNEQLKAVSKEGRLADFTRHIRRSVEKRPHVLIAYSYILFMALFAGGRFLRASLESAAERDAFWEKSPSPVNDLGCHRSPKPPPSTPADEMDLVTGFFNHSDAKHRRHVMNPDGTSLPLSFFHFAGKADGEELKLEFKRRLADAEDMVGPRERHDIVQEAICIFENMLLLVAQLDTVCGTSFDANADVDPIMGSPAAFGTRLRDSVAVAKERRAVAQNMSSDSDGHTDYPNFRGASSGHIHYCPSHSRPGGHRHDASSDSWHSTHASTPSQRGSDDQDECCNLLGKSVRFEPKAPSPDRKRDKPFLSMDGSGSRRSSLCPAAGSDYEKNEFAPISAPKTTTKTIVSNIAMMAAVAALIGTMYFARGRGEETPV
ncbi:hypothetical protein F5X68DRAFT_11717 [Plectosphaerella plurivora]|uniref:Heme oxygenase n=1 Tax=Plectosphaerella plurivora TaxID=936078 RepID=A0A9P8VCS1_9PEZI|nr:hypothetical protein F5X68DRAFT_11717 [Plectosphaerella plurivora]